MENCDYCHCESDYLFDIFKPDYSSIPFRVCLACNVKVFLCPLCLVLRNRDEEYVNGYCIYETKYMREIMERIATLEGKLQNLLGNE